MRVGGHRIDLDRLLVIAERGLVILLAVREDVSQDDERVDVLRVEPQALYAIVNRAVEVAAHHLGLGEIAPCLGDVGVFLDPLRHRGKHLSVLFFCHRFPYTA